MDSISGVNSGQSDLLARVGATVLSQGLKGQEQQASDLLKSLGPAPLPDGSGEQIDTYA